MKTFLASDHVILCSAFYTTYGLDQKQRDRKIISRCILPTAGHRFSAYF